MRTLRGCWWWMGIIGVLLFMVGLILVYPWLLIVTIGLIIIQIFISSRRSKT